MVTTPPPHAQPWLSPLPAQSRWGYNSFVAPAGRHRVRVAVRHACEIGATEQEVDVMAGQTTTLHDSAPVFVVSPGRLGPVPQPHAGLRILYVVLGVLLLMAVVGMVGVLVSA